MAPSRICTEKYEAILIFLSYPPSRIRTCDRLLNPEAKRSLLRGRDATAAYIPYQIYLNNFLLPSLCPPSRIRTCDRLLKRQLLYQPELWVDTGTENYIKYNIIQIKFLLKGFGTGPAELWAEMPEVRLELTCLAAHDFKSCV